MILKEAYFAGGCFWGVEYLMQQQNGVKEVISGYMGGHKDNPTYQEDCYTNTGHLETIKVVYNERIVNYETLAKLFFEIHDPTQITGQGPDIGRQYKSSIFSSNENEIAIAKKLISLLETKGYRVATKIFPMTTFWKAEEYHQDYFEKNGHIPYCHKYTQRF